jgi:hypothetical protein
MINEQARFTRQLNGPGEREDQKWKARDGREHVELRG